MTAEEKLMYQVMKAIYDSGIPIDFKGSMVLKACLLEAGYVEEIRHTVDIDANWYSETAPTAEQMTASLQKALTNNGIDLEVGLYRMYGEGRSAGFELADISTSEILFSMDIDVNRPVVPTQLYEIEGFCFRGVTPVQMLADKISAISTDRVFRRIKDVVDLYYLSKAFAFDSAEIKLTLKNSGRKLENFTGFLNRTDDLRHAYEKFRLTGDVEKPPFEMVYSTVKAYIRDVLPQE
ncbi:MAG: nucleotidyl transferase AbiEii/AbiGii toxin family protein [Oscillospiraceae bacterium]|nr:nucleotidyl transferase AbiEii/AbiGii toxin family protein [Oscillospiraceae bacterium]